MELPEPIEPDHILPVPPARVWTVLTRTDQIRGGCQASDTRSWQCEPGELAHYLAARS